MKENFYISIIAPVYNEEENIKELYLRLTKSLKNTGSFEIIFINDGSSDASFLKLLNLHSRNPKVKIIDFSRNFGQEAAITAGIDYASGDALVVIDSDLQDPPEVILDLVKKWQEGFEVVCARRRMRKEKFLKRFSAFLFYRIFNKISSFKIHSDVGNFYLIDKKVAKALRKIKEKGRFLRGLISFLGFRQAEVFFIRERRKRGQSGYPLKKMLGLATDAITSFSYLPLKLISYFGFIVLTLGIATCIYIFFIPEWQVFDSKTIILLIFFLSGLQFVALGIIGLYIRNIHKELQNRPIYVINKLIGFNDVKK